MQRGTKRTNTGKMKTPTIVRHSIEFESGMRQILGSQVAHTAVMAGIPKEAKKMLQKATNTLSRRTDEIVTMDPRLRELLLSNFDKLRKNMNTIDTSPTILGNLGILYNIVGLLLGYDWLEGKIYRTPIYFRTKSQEFADYLNRTGKDWDKIRQEETDFVVERRTICNDLSKKGMPTNRIARVLNLSEHEVRQYLVDKELEKIAKLLSEGKTYADILHSETGHELFPLIHAISKRIATAKKRLENQ